MSAGSIDASIKFPNPNIPDNNKDGSYHKKFVQAIANRTLDSSFDLVYNVMNESYEYYNGTHVSDEFDFLQEAEDGDVLPAKWMNFNAIKTKIDLQVSEISARGWKVSVAAINKDAVDRKTEAREAMRVEMRMKDMIEELEAEYGLPIQGPKEMPESLDQVDEWFDKKFKEKNEIVMKAGLNGVAKRTDWEFTRMQLYRDLLITGRCFVRNEVVNGEIRARRVDPRRMIYDFDAQDDFLSDSTYFGEVYYAPIYEVAEQYGLSKQEVKVLYESEKSNNYLASLHEGKRIQRLFENTSVRFFRRDKGQLRVLVLNAVWQDQKNFKYKEVKDQWGNDHIKRLSDDSSSEKAKNSPVQIWRRGSLIGGIFMKDYGVMENMTRDADRPFETHAPYSCLIPNYINHQGISTVDQLKELQDYKNLLMYNIQLEINKSGGKGFVYDIGQKPDEWDIHTVIKYLKTVGIAFIDSSQGAGAYNQFGPIDQSFSENVERFLKLVYFVDDQIDQISGVNEARQGESAGASAAVGVTNSMLARSNMITEGRVRLFYQFSSKVFTQLGRLLKIMCVHDPEQFVKIIGDAGVDFLVENLDFDLDDYGIFVEMLPRPVDEEAKFEQLIQIALQAGQIDFHSAYQLISEPDKDYAAREFGRKLEKMKQEAVAAQDRQHQQAMELEGQKSQAGQQHMQAQFQGQAQLANQTEAFKQQGDQQAAILKGEIDKNNATIKELERRITELAKLREAPRKESGG